VRTHADAQAGRLATQPLLAGLQAALKRDLERAQPAGVTGASPGFRFDTQTSQLDVPNDLRFSAHFGASVALSGDGSTALIGVPGVAAGSAVVYIRSGTTWTLNQRLTASDAAQSDSFGGSVALSSDGNTALIGAKNKSVGGQIFAGAAYVFSRSGATWTEQQKLTASDPANRDLFGGNVALSADGNTALISAMQKSVGSTVGSGAAFVFNRSGTAWTQEQELTNPRNAAFDLFGASVALSGDGNTALVGADAPGYPTTPPTPPGIGAAFVFIRSGTTWTLQQTLTAAGGVSGDNFGDAGALSSDGGVALVGAANTAVGSASNAGAAYVFTRARGTWSQQVELTAEDSADNDNFGASVALSGDGMAAVIGAPDKSVAGASSICATILIGKQQVDGASAGGVYVYARDANGWSQQQALTASDAAEDNNFGNSVALSSNGSTALVDAPGKTGGNGACKVGGVYVLTNPAAVVPTATPTSVAPTLTPPPTSTPTPSVTVWRLWQALSAQPAAANDTFGWSVALSSDGTSALVGAPNTTVNGVSRAGAAYFYTRSGNTWTLQQELTAPSGAPGDIFGLSVALSGDGTTALVSAPAKAVAGQPAAGMVYLFTRKGNNWQKPATLALSAAKANDVFGAALALSSDGSTALIGALGRSFGSRASAGAAYVYSRVGGKWRPRQELSLSAAAAGDDFGSAIALSSDGTVALIGAPGKAVVGKSKAGAAYLFTRTGSIWSQPQSLQPARPGSGNEFGSAVALSGDGAIALLGASSTKIGAHPNAGASYLFIHTTSGWRLAQALRNPVQGSGDNFGMSVSVNTSGTIALVGASGKAIGGAGGAGAAFLFMRKGNTWALQRALAAQAGSANDAFGASAALSGDGTVAFIGAKNRLVGGLNGAGTAYVFLRAAASLPAPIDATSTPVPTPTAAE
jgi:hypothetical protein